MGAWLPLLVLLGGPAEAELTSALMERGIDPATLVVEQRESLSRPGLDLVRVHASACGISTAYPIARALVDGVGDRLAWTRLRADAGALPCTPPRLSAEEAIALVAASGHAAVGGAPGTTTATPQWVARSGPSGAGWRLVWRVDPPADLAPDAGAPTDPVFLVDDRTGAVRVLSDRVRSAKVRVYPTNPIATPATSIEDLGAIDDGAAHLEGPWVAAANCIEPDSGEGWCYRERAATPDMAGDFVYPEPDLDAPPEGQDAFAEASGYYHLDRFFSHLQGLGIDQLGCHLEGEVVEIVVNRRKYAGGAWTPQDNAFYTGSCGASTVMMGQGAHDFAYDGDIVYHELSHAVIELLAGEDLGLEQRRDEALVFDAGAINEGVADFLAAAFTDDPLVAEYAFPSGGRSLDNDFRCPRDITGEIHADGQIIGAALWEARAELGDAFVQIVLDALASIDPDASFEDFGQVLEAVTAEALGSAAADTLHEVLDARGVVECTRVVDFDAFGEGGVHEDLGFARLLQVRSPRMGRLYDPAPPAPLQWRVAMPEDADTASLSFALETSYTVDQNLSLGVKHGAPMEFGYAIEGVDVTVSADTDEVVFGADDGEVSFTADPGSTAYIAMLHLGTGDPVTDRWLLLYDFELEFSCAAGEGECAPPDDGETGGTGESGDGLPAHDGADGCGCGVGGPGGGGGTPRLAMWVLPALLFARRRRGRLSRHPGAENRPA